ncbi:MAG: right-handed parallel beta-helix repeat-containing protein [Candidatus Woesearchaeota archaeon]
MKHALIILATFLFIASFVGGADYYVATTGSDSNPGTQSQPWKTIQKAANTVVAADVVHVSQGQYNERVTISRSGVSGSKIVFKSEPGRSAKTQGFVIRGSYIRIESFDITNNGDGAQISGSDVEFVDNFLHEIRGTGIDSSGVRALISGNSLYKIQYGIVVGGDNSVIENNDVQRLYDYGLGDCDYTRFFGTGIVFRNNRFHGTISSEIGSAHVDCFQTFDNNGEYARNILFENNFCTDFAQGLMGEAIYYHNSRNLTFRNNVFAHGGAWGICSVNIAGVTVEHNTFVDTYWYGVGIRGQYGKDAIIKNNIFYEAMNERSYTFYDGGNGIADYNLVYKAKYPSSPGAHDLLGVDPMFVDPNSDDFRPKDGSPACNGGEGGTYIGAFPCGTQAQSCSQAGGTCCASGQTCSGTTKTASDCSICCVGTCQAQQQTCSQAGGICCTSGQTCSGTAASASDCSTCCDGTCQAQQTCIAGDLNCDKKVDIFDLVLVAQNYGKTSGFDTKADANKDGEVNILDLVLVAQNYGKS